MSYALTNNLENNTCAHELDSSYLSNGHLHPAVIRSNNRASHQPSWYLLQCEASQLEAEMSDEENENNTDIDPIEVTIASRATLSSPARASISRKRKIHINEGKYKQ